MPNSRGVGAAAASAAAAKKRKKKAQSKATLERRARAAKKKKAGAEAERENSAEKSAEEAAAEEAAAEKAERARANGKRGREMRTAGRVTDNAPTRADRKMVVEAAQPREAWENAMDLMRKRGTGWVHSRVVEGKMVVLLAQQFKKEGGKILLARRLKKAVACGGDEAAGCGYVVEYGDEAEGVVDDAELLEEDKVDDGDEGWLVQVVGGGSAGDGAARSQKKHALPTPSLRLLHPSPGDHQCTFYFPHTIPGSHPHHAP